MQRLLCSRHAAVLAFGSALLFSTPTAATTNLPSLGATLDELTVSGVSSGAYMAVQFQVAHSRLVRGSGIIAGGPYYCAQGAAWRALLQCMNPPGTDAPSLTNLRAEAETLARDGRIDPLENLRNERVWLLSGGKDQVVKSVVMERLALFFSEWLPPSAIRLIKVPDASHAMISVRDPQAKPCDSNESPYINRCNDLDPAGEMLAHMLGRLHAPSDRTSGEMLHFDQTPFIDGKAIDASLADDAYVYVPRACRVSTCRIHVAFHGCRQSAANIGQRFVDGAGYNAWADSNRLVVLYPQTVPRYGPALGSRLWINNPFACWDWWGYSGSNYHTRDSLQIKAVRAMIEKLTMPRHP